MLEKLLAERDLDILQLHKMLEDLWLPRATANYLLDVHEMGFFSYTAVVTHRLPNYLIGDEIAHNIGGAITGSSELPLQKGDYCLVLRYAWDISDVTPWYVYSPNRRQCYELRDQDLGRYVSYAPYDDTELAMLRNLLPKEYHFKLRNRSAVYSDVYVPPNVRVNVNVPGGEFSMTLTHDYWMTYDLRIRLRSVEHAERFTSFTDLQTRFGELVDLYRKLPTEAVTFNYGDDEQLTLSLKALVRLTLKSTWRYAVGGEWVYGFSSTAELPRVKATLPAYPLPFVQIPSTELWIYGLLPSRMRDSAIFKDYVDTRLALPAGALSYTTVSKEVGSDAR